MRTTSAGASAVSLLLFFSLSLAVAQNSARPELAFQLTHVDTGEPFPAPDGKRLVYESLIAGKYQLFIMSTEGRDHKQITNDPWNHDTPSWSPDGRKIAYVSDQNGHEVIYTIDIDGTHPERLTPDTADSIHPNWSADSKRVIYCSDDDMHPPKKNASEIYVVDVETKKITTIISGGTSTYPSWSPDGAKIVFRRMIGDMNSEVFVANSDGTGVTNLSNHMAFDGWPAWSPDGKKIAFSSNRRANYQIHIMDADGSNVRLLANTEGRATEPRWSVDGKTVFFTNCKKVDFGVDCQVMAAPST